MVTSVPFSGKSSGEPTLLLVYVSIPGRLIPAINDPFLHKLDLASIHGLPSICLTIQGIQVSMEFAYFH